MGDEDRQKVGISMWQFVNSMRGQFLRRISAKNGWGKNEIIAQFDMSMMHALVEQIDKSLVVNNDLPSSKLPD